MNRQRAFCHFGNWSKLRHAPSVLVVLLALSSLTLDSCRHAKQAQKNDGTTTPRDSSITLVDSAKGIISKEYDSLSNKVSKFFSSLLPPKHDTIAAAIIQTSPPSGLTPPTVSGPPPSEPGFLSPAIKRKIEFDSGGKVIEHDVFLGADIRTPSSVSFADYLKRQQEDALTQSFKAMIKKQQDTGKTVEATTGILGDYGNIQIPIPPSIVPTIFGRPSINLRVSGDVAVHLAYRDNQTYATSGANFYGSEQGLDFKQEINVSTNGTIGDKLKIGADWGSDRMFQFDNLLKFNYVGFPDEILQNFDAGNVTFNTPSQYIGAQQDLFGLKAVTRFGPVYVTLLAAQKKGERQNRSFGGGSGVATEHVIRPIEYRRNRFFLDTAFSHYYESYYATIPPNSDAVTNSGQEYVDDPKSVEVWVGTTNITAVNKRHAVAWYNLGPQPQGGYPATLRYFTGSGTDSNLVAQGYFTKITDTNRYYVEPYTGVLVLNQEPDDGQLLAVSYKTTRGTKQYGDPEVTTDSNLVLKLLKPIKGFQSTTIPSWKNILKNTYYIGGANFDEKDFSVRIIAQQPGGHQAEYFRLANKQSPQKAISVLGLDRYQNSSGSGVKTPDGLVDFGSQFQTSPVVEKKTGTLVFPYLEPFGKRIRDFDTLQHNISSKYQADTTFYMPEIYNTTQDVLRYRETKQVSINVKFTGGVSSTLNLNAFNLVEGSVRVTINGTPLVENTDFRVDYNSGTVTILKPDLVQTGQINVEYDVHDIFTNATKNVLGLRAEMPLADKGVIGTTLMNYSMHLPTLKTRQGEEPLSNWIWGVDGSYKVDAPFLTDALNFLPIFNLKDKSELSIRGDAALSLPNPNTEKSPMAVDNNASIAYLDDFEGGLNQFPLYMNYGRWVPASQPADSAMQAKYAPSPTAVDSEYWLNPVNQIKGKTKWYSPNPLPSIHDIKPNKQTATPSDVAQVMDFVFDPTRPGIYNPQPANAPNTDKWGGMMQYAPGLNVASTNTDAVSVWLKINGMDPADAPNAVLRFDLGRISEDIIPNKRLDFEDKNGNGRYDDGEDIGLDGMTDDQERAAFPGAVDHNDPSNDNYQDYTADPSFDHLNGEQGNETDAQSGLKPGTEDLDGNGSLNLDNGYYEYEIPLNLQSNKYVVGNTAGTGWYQLRIPLADYNRIVGTQDSSFSNIAYYRIWMEGVNKPVDVQMYELMLVGSQWTRGSVGLSQTNPVGDQSLKVGYVDFEDNSGPPTNYCGPPGVQRELVPGQTTYIQGNEQSLNMELNNVEDTGRRQAERLFPTPNDIFNYRSMAIWVHGDPTKYPQTFTNSPADTAACTWVYVRFGSDQYNYYEYRRPLIAPTDNGNCGWQNIHIDFATLTALKASRIRPDSIMTKVVNDGTDGSQYATYRVVGGPTLTNAPYFVLGVENHEHKPLTTNVWWDELRLLDANNSVDYAYNASMQMKLAEFGRITAGMTNERPDFHRVDERFSATRALNLNWNVTGEFALEKLLPKWMEDKQTKLPLTISHAESILRPKYIVNTDIDLNQTVATLQADKAANPANAAVDQYLIDSLQLNNETLQVKNSIGASDIALRFPGSFFLIPGFVNRLSFGAGYAETYLRSPQYEYDRKWSWTGSIRYSLPPLPSWGFAPFTWIGNTFPFIGPYTGWKITPLPSNVNFILSATRGRDNSLNRLSTLTLPPEGSQQEDTLAVLRSRVPTINRIFTATRGMSMNWKPFEGGMLSPSFEYALDVSSNLAPFETYSTFNKPTRYDANGNPIYDYDSVYVYQRSVSDILHDIFPKNGSLVNPGQDFNASQKLHMGTSPKLPGLFGFEKLVRPVFDYRVEYRWQNSQTTQQNAKQGAWNNTITTGLEFNMRDLGIILFGKPITEEAPVQRGHGRDSRDRGEIGMIPEELPEHGGEERASPFPNPREEGRNPVDRGEDMRLTSRGNPLGRTKYITDTMHRNPQPVPLDTVGKIHSRGVGTAGEPGGEFAVDTVLTPVAPPIEIPVPIFVESTPPITIQKIAQALIQKPFFDWNGTRFNFTQTNSSLNGALMGNNSGITNFLARGIFAPEDDMNGPSRAYQLGLITDPSGRLLFHWQNHFPFLYYSVRHGLRAADPLGGSIDITDAFTQTNNFELTTSRPLWSGAQINLNWKLSFGFDERDALHVNSFGADSLMYAVKAGDVSRTFLSIPPLPFFNVLQSGILRVGEKYRDAVLAAGAPNVDTARAMLPPDVHNRIEREAFMQGFETLPFFTGILREYLPRLNYSFSQTGLEKFFLFSFCDHMSFRNAYNGTYKRSFRQNAGDSLNLTALQTIVYGFRPLIALDMSWDKLMNGKMTASLNYDTQTEWAADYSSARITKRLSTTIGVTANYQRQGMSIPFLKLNLKNEFGASLTFSETISGDSYYNFWSIDPGTPDGISNGGLTKTTLEPRVSYTVNSQLTLEGFYRYERTTPAASGLISPPTRLIMAGVDVRLKIQ